MNVAEPCEHPATTTISRHGTMEETVCTGCLQAALVSVLKPRAEFNSGIFHRADI